MNFVRSDPQVELQLFSTTTGHLPIPLQFPQQAMQTWRRTFATSVARLGHNNNSPLSKTPGPAVLRCAQLLQESKKTGTSSFEEQEIRINGFIRSVRKQKRFAFAQISDGSTVEPLQAFLTPAQASQYVPFRPARFWATAHSSGFTS